MSASREEGRKEGRKEDPKGEEREEPPSGEAVDRRSLRRSEQKPYQYDDEAATKRQKLNAPTEIKRDDAPVRVPRGGRAGPGPPRER